VVFTFLNEKEGVAQLTPMLNLPRLPLLINMVAFEAATPFLSKYGHFSEYVDQILLILRHYIMYKYIN